MARELADYVLKMNRVFVRLVGGLGNQLFQYATARAVALRNDSSLLLDIRETTDGGGKWPYALKHFCIKGQIATSPELPPPRSAKLCYQLWKLFGRQPQLVREKGLALNANIHSLGPECYLHGYFQSESYFTDIAVKLRRELKFSTPPNSQNEELITAIANDNAVSLHVRRGDYLTEPNTGIFASCRQSYYDAAIAYIAERAGAPTIYVFSDDPDWVRENLDFRFPSVVIDHNQGNRDYEDLRLMSICRHNIIANSSFSWWGAWLNPNPDKIVVAPQVWFTPGKANNPDIVPSRWYQIAN